MSEDRRIGRAYATDRVELFRQLYLEGKLDAVLIPEHVDITEIAKDIFAAPDEPEPRGNREEN